jgi:hypothetical protein
VTVQLSDEVPTGHEDAVVLVRLLVVVAFVWVTAIGVIVVGALPVRIVASTRV